MILLLLIAMPLSSSSLTYYPEERTFALRTPDIYIDSKESEFYLQRGDIEAGRLTDENIQSLYSPFFRKTEISGLSYTKDRGKLFLLYYPSLSEGYTYENRGLHLSFLVDRGSEIDDLLLMLNSQRGCWDGVRGEIGLEHSIWVAGLTFGFFPALGFKYVYRAGVKWQGAELCYTRGEFPVMGRKLEEYLKLEYRSPYLDILYSLGRGSGPVKVGTWRERYSRERLTLKLYGTRFTVEQSGFYSSTGKRSGTSTVTLSISSWDISVRDLDLVYLAYRRGGVSMRIGTDGSWRISLEAERKRVKMNFTITSSQESSAYITYIF